MTSVAARIGSARERYANAEAGEKRQDAAFLARMVDAGLRAQLRPGNLLTGQLYVAFDFMPRVARAELVASNGTLTMPTVPSAFADLQPQLADIINRISKIPFDEIGSDLQATLKSTNTTVQTLQKTLVSVSATLDRLSPQAEGALLDVRKTLDSAQRALDGINRNIAQTDAPLQRNANGALQELQRASQALRVLGEYLQQHPESILRGKPADADLTSSTGGSR